MIRLFKRDKPVIRERASHCISRAHIDPDALKVLYRLANTNYTAYLVGGSVRDLLLGRKPKDFDIGTDARPNDIRRLFRNCFLIGRRFRLAHIVFGRKVIETSTFRRQPDIDETDASLYQTADNTFGTPAEDARRRDFTVNGLFYDIKTFAVIDYVGGLKDLEKKTMRCIGDPNIRFREDPVRMMRAIKFAARLDFTIDRESRKAILKHHAHILKASMPRLCEEIFRLFTYNTSGKAFSLMWEFNLLQDLLPEVHNFIETTGKHKSPLWRYLTALDQDTRNSDFSNGIRLACLYYPLFLDQLHQAEKSQPHGRINKQHLARLLLTPITQRLHIPKATLYTTIALMDTPRRFTESPKKHKAGNFINHSIFPEALAFQRIILMAEHRDSLLLNEWQALYDLQMARIPLNQESPTLSSEEAHAARDAEAEMPRNRQHHHRRRPYQQPILKQDQRPTPSHTPLPATITVTEISNSMNH